MKLAFVGTAIATDPQVEAVILAVAMAKGKIEKTKYGPSLKLVDLVRPGTSSLPTRTHTTPPQFNR
jgi:hypothetical protein